MYAIKRPFLVRRKKLEKKWMGLQTHFKGDTVETGLYVVYIHCLVTHTNILYSIYSVYARVKTAQFTLFKGTHARDIQSLFLKFFWIIQSLIDTKRSSVNIFKNIL
jgi:hypothetical protein